MKNNVFLLFALRNIKVEPTEFQQIGSEILAFMTENARGFVTSKFRENEINEIWNGNQRLYVKILNKSCELPIELKKSCLLAFFVAEPEHLKFENKTTTRIRKSKKKKQTT